MDDASELRKAKWLIVAGLAFCVSGCLSFSELNYLARGRTVEAEIREVLDTERGRRNREVPVRLEKYTYREPDGTIRDADDVMAADWAPPGDPGTVPVEFIPGSEYSSRVAGTGAIWPAYVFGGSLVAFGWFGWRLAKEANEPPRRTPAYARSKPRTVRGR